MTARHELPGPHPETGSQTARQTFLFDAKPHSPAPSALKDDPRPPGCVKLKGYDSEYRVRISDYRVRYAVIDRESAVVLLHCKDRKEVYRR